MLFAALYYSGILYRVYTKFLYEFLAWLFYSMDKGVWCPQKWTVDIYRKKKYDGGMKNPIREEMAK